jgi:hypothetical protein
MVMSKAKKYGIWLVVLILVVAAACSYALRYPGNAGEKGTRYSYQNESMRATQNGYAPSASAFLCNSSAQCVKVQVAQCDNNNPLQFVCVNYNYLSEFANRTRSGGPVACPQYMLAGIISCSCVSNHCAEGYSSSTS